MVWPNGCVQCAAEPTRFDEVGTYNVNKGLLVVGAARVKTFKLQGVPYCNAHKKAVEMNTGIGNSLYLDWRSLAIFGSEPRAVCGVGSFRRKAKAARRSRL